MSRAVWLTRRTHATLDHRQGRAGEDNTDNTVNTAQIGKRKCTPSTHNGHFEFTRAGAFETTRGFITHLHYDRNASVLIVFRGFTQFGCSEVSRLYA